MYVDAESCLLCMKCTNSKGGHSKSLRVINLVVIWNNIHISGVCTTNLLLFKVRGKANIYNKQKYKNRQDNAQVSSLRGNN